MKLRCCFSGLGHLCITGYLCVLQGISRYYRAPLGITGYLWALQGTSRYYRAPLGIAEYLRILQGTSGSVRVSLYYRAPLHITEYLVYLLQGISGCCGVSCLLQGISVVQGIFVFWGMYNMGYFYIMGFLLQDICIRVFLFWGIPFYRVSLR